MVACSTGKYLTDLNLFTIHICSCKILSKNSVDDAYEFA